MGWLSDALYYMEHSRIDLDALSKEIGVHLPEVEFIEGDNEELFVNGESVCCHKHLYITDVLDVLDKCGIIKYNNIDMR